MKSQVVTYIDPQYAHGKLKSSVTFLVLNVFELVGGYLAY